MTTTRIPFTPTECDCQSSSSKHAFANETLVGDRKLPIAEYNAPAAELAWTRTIEFFGRHLK